jgi:hypothetical protein
MGVHRRHRDLGWSSLTRPPSGGSDPSPSLDARVASAGVRRPARRANRRPALPQRGAYGRTQGAGASTAPTSRAINHRCANRSRGAAQHPDPASGAVRRRRGAIAVLERHAAKPADLSWPGRPGCPRRSRPPSGRLTCSAWSPARQSSSTTPRRRPAEFTGAVIGRGSAAPSRPPISAPAHEAAPRWSASRYGIEPGRGEALAVVALLGLELDQVGRRDRRRLGGCDARLGALGRRLTALVRGCGGVARAPSQRRTQAAEEAEELRDAGCSRGA